MNTYVSVYSASPKVAGGFDNAMSYRFDNAIAVTCYAPTKIFHSESDLQLLVIVMLEHCTGVGLYWGWLVLIEILLLIGTGNFVYLSMIYFF